MLLGCLLGLASVCGCASSSLNRSRNLFYNGDAQAASELLVTNTVSDTDQVLFLLERATILQAIGDYEGSSADYVAASDWIERRQSYSVSRGATSMVVNDSVQEFMGAPYERTYMHAFTALNHMAGRRWNDAAVEGRRIVYGLSPETRGEYPDSAFCRYVAGLCFELIDDHSNAALQYGKAGELVSQVTIDKNTGRLGAESMKQGRTASAWPDGERGSNLVCFLMTGRSLSGRGKAPEGTASNLTGYAEIYYGDRYLGRSYCLDDTYRLARLTDGIEAVKRALKTSGRIGFKEILAGAAGEAAESEAVEDLMRLVLIGMLERPDTRRWETLPRGLHVARVPWSDNQAGYRIVYRGPGGQELYSGTVTYPLARRRRTTVSFHRIPLQSD